MQLKRSRFGQFFACTGYPECKNTKGPRLLKANIPTERQPPCDNCGKEMVLKSGRYGPSSAAPAIPPAATIRKIAAAGHASEAEWREMPDVQGMRARRAPFAPRRLLQLLALSEVRPRLYSA
jgi:ssDNA-binding Zn-finger/Zn-ribbon topoisomerase 1